MALIPNLHTSFLITLISLSVLLTTETYAAEKPYEAKTADECILEKECVWHAFEMQLNGSMGATGGYPKNYISKWAGPIEVFAAGKSAEKFLPVIVDTSKQLAPYISVPMNVNFRSNFLFMFTDDMDKGFAELEPILDKHMTEKGSARRWYEKAKPLAKGCIGMGGSQGKSQDIAFQFLIIDTTDPYAAYCTASDFYASLGMAGYMKEQPFSFLSSKDTKVLKFTKLDQFLLYLLYQKEFKSGQTPEKVKAVFSKIYPSARDHFLKNIGSK